MSSAQAFSATRVRLSRLLIGAVGLCGIWMGIDADGTVTPVTVALAALIGAVSVGVCLLLRRLGEATDWTARRVAAVSGCGAAISTLLARFASGPSENYLLIFFGSLLVAVAASNAAAKRGQGGR